MRLSWALETRVLREKRRRSMLWHRRRVLPAIVLLSLAIGACSDPPGDGRPPSPADAVFPITLTDDDGVEVTLGREPRRIITFAPSITEIVFALGEGSRLVGVSGAFDDHPPEAAEIEHVGGAGEFGVDPNVEKVVSLEPDLFLTIKGGDQWKERLRELGVPVVTLDAVDLEDLLDDIVTVGGLLGAPAHREALDLVGRMEAEADEITRTVGRSPPVTCVFEVFYGPPLTTVGPGTFLSDLLSRAGCESVSDGARTQYPNWSVDRLVEADPDVYLVSSESGVSPEAVGERPGFDAVTAVAEGRVVLIDSDLVSRAGPRVVEGLRLLAEALHPEAFAA
jgi:iron complex transport system substrate-binding protein